MIVIEVQARGIDDSPPLRNELLKAIEANKFVLKGSSVCF